MLAPGDAVPDFALPDQSGTVVRLSELLSKGPVVLFFYPAAMTTGCTAEACNFRDLAAEFSQAGAQRLGISVDSVDKQKEFADKNSFDYPLLSDVDREVAAAFGVRRRFGPSPVKRATFVIGQDGLVIHTISSELRMNKHADEALVVLNTPR
ncbi:MAG TPA: peroxiredoxin [Kineosporiaceae bacterium]|nr:peroxiredoxin [Kineosporiaceae bacterium]